MSSQDSCRGKDFVFSLRASRTLVFIADGKTICALQACMYILQVAAFENVTPKMDISVSSHKLLRHPHFGPHEVTQVDRFVFPDGHLVIVLPQADCRFWFCASRVPGWEGLKGMKVDIIKPQVVRFVFPVAHDVIVLASDRLRFLNLGCDTGHLSFEMSCSFTVQVPAQLDLLRKVTSIKAYKNVFQLLPKELDAGALDGEELLVVELEMRLLEVKSRAQVSREFPPSPQGRLRHQRSRSAGYDCVNNATVRKGRV